MDIVWEVSHEDVRHACSMQACRTSMQGFAATSCQLTTASSRTARSRRFGGSPERCGESCRAARRRPSNGIGVVVGQGKAKRRWFDPFPPSGPVGVWMLELAECSGPDASPRRDRAGAQRQAVINHLLGRTTMQRTRVLRLRRRRAPCRGLGRATRRCSDRCRRAVRHACAAPSHRRGLRLRVDQLVNVSDVEPAPGDTGPSGDII